jgi:hypothetical protein
MAVLKYCPTCEQSQEVTKKGFNKDNEQLWICKVCGKKFVSVTGIGKKKSVAKVAPTKKTLTKSAVKKVLPKTTGTTEIIVNNNVIKTVPGLLTLDTAFDMVSSYFKEIAKEKATISETPGKKVITFKIKSGDKG